MSGNLKKQPCGTQTKNKGAPVRGESLIFVVAGTRKAVFFLFLKHLCKISRCEMEELSNFLSRARSTKVIQTEAVFF